jgi:hypothetical protein
VIVPDVRYIAFPDVSADELNTKLDDTPDVVVLAPVNVCDPLAPVLKLSVEPEVVFPIEVLPVEVLMFTGAPFIANVPLDVSVAEDSPVEFILPEVDVNESAPVV